MIVSGALIALRGFCVLRRGKACRLSPHPFAGLKRSFLRSAPDLLLTNPITSPKIREPASLRSDG